MKRDAVAAAVRRNLRWFVASGIMTPGDGSWGVAERILVTENEELRRLVRREFPAYTPCAGYDVIESRRPDCCFEAAALFLAAERVFPGDGYREIAGNILDFLFFRSGLLNRDNSRLPRGAWHWSHVSRDVFWVDDNGWCAALQLEIFSALPELRERYDQEGLVHQLAANLGAVLERSLHETPPENGERWEDPLREWRGYFELPHWGVPVCIALVADDRARRDSRWKPLLQRYFDHISRLASSLSASEKIYALIGCCFAAECGDGAAAELAGRIGGEIIAVMDPITGIIPSEHYEAPRGSGLADLIYTMNWALIAFQRLARLNPAGEIVAAYHRVGDFLLSAQINSPVPHMDGAWRGMCDRNGWAAGGECIEGGAGCIYSGWTNAPISLTLLGELFAPVSTQQHGGFEQCK